MRWPLTPRLKNDVARGLPFAAGRRLVVLGNDFDQVSAIMKPDNYNANNINRFAVRE